MATEVVKLLRTGQTISSISRSSNVVTVTLSAAYPNGNLKVDQGIVISGVTDSGFNGTFTIASVASQTSFTYSQTGSDTSSSGGSAGGDYTTLSAFDAAQQRDLVSADEIAVLEVYDDWASGLSTYEEIRGDTEWTTSTTQYVHIRAASGEGTDGTDIGALLLTDSGTYGAARVVRANVKFSGLRIHATTNYPAIDSYLDGSGQFTLLDGCYIKSAGNGSTRGALTVGLTPAAGSYVEARNSIFDTCNRVFTAGSAIDRVLFRNCVSFDSPNYSFMRCLCVNSASIGSGTADFYSLATGSDYNASEDSTATNTHDITGIDSSDFVDSANGDYHIVSGSALQGAGTNLYSTFQYDIDGDEWPSSGAWDIGFDYYVSAGGGTPTLSLPGVIDVLSDRATPQVTLTF